MIKNKQLRKVLSITLCLALTLSFFAGLNLVEENPATASTANVERLFGANRFATASTVAAKKFTTSSHVIVTRGDVLADGLAASVLAGALNAPILLTEVNSLPTETRSRIQALGLPHVIILGGTSAVSAAVENALRDLVGTAKVTRVGGANRNATAALIAAEAARHTVLSTTAFIVNGFAPADSLVAGPKAFLDKMPILQVNQNSIPPETTQAITARGITRLIVVGGTAVVSATVYNQLSAIVGTGNISRIAGATRYDTSVEFARSQFAGVRNFTLVRGADFNLADAVGSTVLGYPILYSELNSVPAGVNTYLDQQVTSASLGFVIGGTLALAQAVEDAFKAKIAGGPVFSPVQGATAVSTAVNPTITYARAVSQTNGLAITPAALQTLVTFREGSSTGPAVSFTASIDTAGRVITVAPSAALKANTTYYLAIDTVRDTTGNIPGGSVTWSTGTGVATTALAVQSITALTPTVMRVVFNNELGDSARLIASYAMFHLGTPLPITAVSLSANLREVELTLGTALEAGKTYAIYWLNITDPSGTKMAETHRFWTPDVTTAKPTLTSASITVLTNGTASIPGAFMITLPEKTSATIAPVSLTLRKGGTGDDLVTAGPIYTVGTLPTEPGMLIVKLDSGKLLDAGTYNLQLDANTLDRFGVKNDAFSFNFSVSTITARKAAVTASQLLVDSGRLWYEITFSLPVDTEGTTAGTVVIKNEESDYVILRPAQAENSPVTRVYIEIGILAGTAGRFLAGKSYATTIPAAWKTAGSREDTAAASRSVAGIDTVPPKVTAIELLSARQARITFNKAVRLVSTYDFTFHGLQVKYADNGAVTARATASGNTITLDTVNVGNLNLPTTFVRTAGLTFDPNAHITNSLGFPMSAGSSTYYLKTGTIGLPEERLVTDDIGPQVVSAVSASNTVTLKFSEAVATVAGGTTVNVLVKKAGEPAYQEYTMTLAGTTATIPVPGTAPGDLVRIVSNSLKSANDDQPMLTVTVTTQ